MKKLLMPLILVVILTALPFYVGHGAEAQIGGTVGWLVQDGQQAQLAYDVGIDISIVDVGKGWSLKSKAGGLYSERPIAGIPEVLVLRVTPVIERYLAVGVDANGDRKWSIHLAISVPFLPGYWQFFNTGGPDIRAPGFYLGLGFMWHDVTLDFGLEAVQMPDMPDIYYPQAQLTIPLEREA